MKDSRSSIFSLLIFVSQAISGSHHVDVLSQQCYLKSLQLSANLACSRLDAVDFVSQINSSLSIEENSAVNLHLLEDYAPWSYEPVCTEYLENVGSELCVYTNAMFSGGRGISIFTTPRIAQEFASSLPFQDPSALDEINVSKDQWYTKKLPGKGMALMAARELKRGDRITAYTPALLAHMEQALSTQKREHYLRIAVNQLPRATRESYYTLATIFGDPSVIAQDVVKANAFEMQIGGQMHLAVFPETSRMNHDCGPK